MLGSDNGSCASSPPLCVSCSLQYAKPNSGIGFPGALELVQQVGAEAKGRNAITTVVTTQTTEALMSENGSIVEE